MTRTIDYYFTLVSPWAYIGHRVFVKTAMRHGAKIAYKPVALGAVFPESGGLPLMKRHPLRVRYRDMELQRWREKRGLAFHMKPAFWPFEPTFLDGIVVALAARGDDVERFLPQAFAATFERQQDLTDPGVVADLLTNGGLDAPAVMRPLSIPRRKRHTRRIRKVRLRRASSVHRPMCSTARSSGVRIGSSSWTRRSRAGAQPFVQWMRRRPRTRSPSGRGNT